MAVKKAFRSNVWARSLQAAGLALLVTVSVRYTITAELCCLLLEMVPNDWSFTAPKLCQPQPLQAAVVLIHATGNGTGNGGVAARRTAA